MGKRDAELQRAIGGRVQATREKRGMSRNELAAAIGLSDGTALYKYERGARGFSVGQLTLLAETLDSTIEWFVYGKEYPERKNAVTRVAAAEPPSYGTSRQPPVSAQLISRVLRDLGPMTEGYDLPQPILDLINLGWIKSITNDDLRHLRLHLLHGGRGDPHDMTVAVWANRLQRDGSDENLRALNDANRARTEHLGYERVKESEAPRPLTRPPANEVAANDRPKHIKPRLRRRTRPDGDKP